MKKWSNTYYQNHKDTTIKDYLERTRERRLAWGHKYYEEHKEERARYYQENKDKILKSRKARRIKKKDAKEVFKEKLTSLLKKEDIDNDK